MPLVKLFERSFQTLLNVRRIAQVDARVTLDGDGAIHVAALLYDKEATAWRNRCVRVDAAGQYAAYERDGYITSRDLFRRHDFSSAPWLSPYNADTETDFDGVFLRREPWGDSLIRTDNCYREQWRAELRGLGPVAHNGLVRLCFAAGYVYCVLARGFTESAHGRHVVQKRSMRDGSLCWALELPENVDPEYVTALSTDKLLLFYANRTQAEHDALVEAGQVDGHANALYIEKICVLNADGVTESEILTDTDYRHWFMSGTIQALRDESGGLCLYVHSYGNISDGSGQGDLEGHRWILMDAEGREVLRREVAEAWFRPAGGIGFRQTLPRVGCFADARYLFEEEVTHIAHLPGKQCINRRRVYKKDLYTGARKEILAVENAYLYLDIIRVYRGCYILCFSAEYKKVTIVHGFDGQTDAPIFPPQVVRGRVADVKLYGGRLYVATEYKLAVYKVGG